MALPTLTGFKQEAPSPPNGDHGYENIPIASHFCILVHFSYNVFFLWYFIRRLGHNPSPPQTNERASSEGRSVTSLAGHAHGGSADHQQAYSHPFQHMLHQHSSWNSQDPLSGAGPITGGVGTGSASSLASSSSNEGMPSSSSGGLHHHHLLQQQQQLGGAANSSGSAYHGEKYKYDRLNEADANADNRFVLSALFYSLSSSIQFVNLNVHLIGFSMFWPRRHPSPRR